MKWTFKQIMDRIKEGNTGKPAMDRMGNCQYLTHGGNRCVIGCFIPQRVLPRVAGLAVPDLLRLHPSLQDYMPSRSVKWLKDFQKEHDFGRSDGTLHHALALWLLLNPPPDAPRNYYEGVSA